MTRDRYKISYGTPLALRDRPHREVDTARDGLGAMARDDFGRENVVVISEFTTCDAVEIVEPKLEEIVFAGTD